MALRSFHRPPKKREQAMMLLEATAAATFFALVTMFYISIMYKHFELSKRARDLDLIEALVNKDISALRHQSRLWHVQRFYSSSSDNGNIIVSPSALIYYNKSTDCFPWSQGKGILEKNAFSDTSNYTNNIPGTIELSLRGQIGSVSEYTIRRIVSFPSLTTVNINANHAPQTLRVSYIVEISGKPSQPFAFERTADIQIPAGNFC